jgi:hypothetical protein
MNVNGLKVLVYDLTSENHAALKNTEFYDKIKSVRVRCTQQLHRLGIMCTESVILISHKNERHVDQVIHRVMSAYEAVLSEINSTLSVNLPKPVIRVLMLSRDQYDVFRELAENRIRTLIDMHVDKVTALLERQNGNSDKRLIRSLRKLLREWIRIRALCHELGIDLDSEIGYLVSLISDAISQLRGE